MKPMINVYPIATEKAYALSKSNVFLFTAPTNANKDQIKQAIQTQFSVKVVSIRSSVRTGKAISVRLGKRNRPGTTKHSDVKKIFVTLAKGDSIKIFEEKAEDAKKATKSIKEKK